MFYPSVTTDQDTVHCCSQHEKLLAADCMPARENEGSQFAVLQHNTEFLVVVGIAWALSPGAHVVLDRHLYVVVSDSYDCLSAHMPDVLGSHLLPVGEDLVLSCHDRTKTVRQDLATSYLEFEP